MLLGKTFSGLKSGVSGGSIALSHAQIMRMLLDVS